MKKLVAALLLGSLFISACSFGGSSSDASDLTLVEQKFQQFSIGVPSTWQKISPENFANTIPKETIAIYLNKLPSDDFIQNITLVSEDLKTEVLSIEYAKASVLLGSKGLYDYREVSAEEVQISSEKTVLHEFLARGTSTGPLRHFIQSYFTFGSSGLTVTCTSKESDVNQQNVCRNSIKSIVLKLSAN